MYVPCMYRTKTQTTGPKMKSCSRVGISVNGMQNTVSRRSAILRFSNRTFVNVRIRRFWAIVSATSALPQTERTNMMTYRAMRSSTWMPGPADNGRVALLLRDELLSHDELTMSLSDAIMCRRLYRQTRLLNSRGMFSTFYCCPPLNSPDIRHIPSNRRNVESTKPVYSPRCF